MKSQDKAAIRELPVGELEAQLLDAEDKLVRLKFAHAVSPVKNPLEIQKLRRHRARLLTWIAQKKGAAAQEKKK